VDEEASRALARVGHVLNEKWTLEHLLGLGGMAAVYEATHRNGARAAVKVLHEALARLPDVRERFLREGYAANKVDHRGVVKVLDDDVVKEGEDAGLAYLVMELLEGESLEARIERPPPLDERELLAIMDEVLAVLEAAHDKGVVHRDLKPDNIFLVAADAAQDGPRVKVLDFGLARLSDAATGSIAGMALGTPSYMSPEQAAGLVDEIDGRTDIFALGATAFRILTGGERVHEADNAIELVTLMATKPARPVREVAPRVSARVAAIVDRALAFDRAARYPTAAAMRADVRAALDDIAERRAAMEAAPTLPAFEPPPISKLGAVEESVTEPYTPPPPPRKRRSVVPWIVALLVGGVLASQIFSPLKEAVREGSDAAAGDTDARAPSVDDDAAWTPFATISISGEADASVALDASRLDAAPDADEEEDGGEDDDDFDASISLDAARAADGHGNVAPAPTKHPAIKRKPHPRPPRKRRR
jgi:serine/threonine protein kinase